MINLYQRLNLPPTASRAEIEAALAQYRSELSNAEIRGVQEWLLVNEVRHRYDAKLRQEQPSFFIPSQKQPAPAAPSHSRYGGYYTPKLYNPTAAAVLGILLSPIIGAWLHAINWRELGNEDAARQNMYVVYGTFAFGILSMLLYFFAAIEIPIYTGSLIALGWFFSIGKNQIDFLRREAGNEYMRKKWGKVVMWIIFGILAYFFVYYFALYLLYTSGSLHPEIMELISQGVEEAVRATAQP